MTDFDLVVIGDWHLALCTAVSFSHARTKTLVKLTNGPTRVEPGCPPSPVREPDFEEFTREGVERGTLFQSGQWQGWRASAWWLAIDTPVDDNDVPQTQVLFDTLDAGFRENKPALLIVSSQVPVGFCSTLR